MDVSQVRVVVGEGDSPRRGLLRFVLEGDGYDVVGEASTPAELARVLADHLPDVVVLDDALGATAPQLAKEISPRTKIVLVWPGAVVPIGGDARVEPSQVLRQLGPAVATLAAGIVGLSTIERPEWIEKVRKDPATLRERLERGGGLPTKRPSVTELQRRGQRLHPSPAPEPARGGDDAGIAPVLPLVAAAGAASSPEATIELPDTPESGEPILRLPDDDRDDGAVVPIGAAAGVILADPQATELNRRLGTIALGGAAVVGAVVFALALGGSRVSTEIIVAVGPRATIAPGPPIDSGIDEPEPTPEPTPEPGPDGETPPVDAPRTDVPPPTGNEPPVPGGGGPTPRGGGTQPPPEIPDGGGPPVVSAPGRSAFSNPHGVPPGQTDAPRDASSSGSGPSGNGARHWVDGLPGHAGQHGRGIERGQGLAKKGPAGPEHVHKP